MILVTGATGLVGSFVVKELLKQKEKVRIFLRKTSDTILINNILPKVELAYGELNDLTSLEEALEGVHVVIHAAALVSFAPKDTKKLKEINVDGTANLVNLCLEKQIDRFLHVSSIAAIGKDPLKKELDETTKWNPDETYSNYASSKHLGELEVWRGMEEGLNSVIVNPSVILGPSSYTKSSGEVFRNAKKMGLISTKSKVSLVDVRDVAVIIVSLLNSTIRNERFILNSGTYDLTQIITKIRAQFQLAPPKFILSHRLLKIVTILYQLILLPTFKSPRITLSKVNAMSELTSFNGSKITKAIHFKYTTIDDTIAWCCKN